MKSKVSIYDIAKYLNVSPATVSYAINGVDKVSKKTRERVLKAAKKLNFVLDNTARSLSTGKSHLIGLFLPLDDPSLALSQNPFYVEFLSGIEKSISKSNYDIVLGSQKVSTNFYSWAKSRNLDAAILLGRYPQTSMDDINSLNIPLVLVDIYDSQLQNSHIIRINDRLGTYIATKHLIENGHKKIGFVGYKNISTLDRERYEGYCQALHEANLEVNDLYQYDCLATLNDGYKIAEKIASDNFVTGVVCVADIIALGIIRKYHALNLEIPKDLSIIGFDDICEAQYSIPALTTIKQDISDRGARAIDLLINELSSPSSSQQNIVLNPHLIERKSVKKL